MYAFQKNLSESFNKNIESLTVYQCEQFFFKKLKSGNAVANRKNNLYFSDLNSEIGVNVVNFEYIFYISASQSILQI